MRARLRLGPQERDSKRAIVVAAEPIVEALRTSPDVATETAAQALTEQIEAASATGVDSDQAVALAGNRSSNAACQGKTQMAKPGRNDPCPCGSGKKYKRCCLDKDEAAGRAALAAALPSRPPPRELSDVAAEIADRPRSGSLGSNATMSAGDGRTTELRIRISRRGGGSARCSGSRARVQPRNFFPHTPPSTIPLTSNAISSQPKRTARFALRR